MKPLGSVLNFYCIFAKKLMNFATKNHYQCSPAVLINHTIERKQGYLNNQGALCILTGKFTGRSPEDRFIVKDEYTESKIDWNHYNQPIDDHVFQHLKQRILSYFKQLPEAWVRDAYVCTDPAYKLNIRVVNEHPWSNLFCYNMFIRPTEQELANFSYDWLILQAPGFKANPQTDGVPNENFALLSFTEKTILIGGTGYTGEMKKGIFSALNCILPSEHHILGMHCSANIGEQQDISLYFGLSGTGKTTLSTAPNRTLIGDDEHGWGNQEIFNFEGGCYAKVINLNKQKEADIYNAIRFGSLLENVVCFPNSVEVDYNNSTITQNTRVCYPLHFISNSTPDYFKQNPKNIFFLTCDSFGVLPPISKLTKEQAMYQFISGYTAKVAGTEMGVKSPKETFSACFGAPFMTLHPNKYALLLGEKIEKNNVHIWLINTGWSGGPYGVGKRIDLVYTRAMIDAALQGELDQVEYDLMPVFNFAIPLTCTGVPSDILNPKNTWVDKNFYEEELRLLAQKFRANFNQFISSVSPEIVAAQPQI